MRRALVLAALLAGCGVKAPPRPPEPDRPPATSTPTSTSRPTSPPPSQPDP